LPCTSLRKELRRIGLRVGQVEEDAAVARRRGDAIRTRIERLEVRLAQRDVALVVARRPVGNGEILDDRIGHRLARQEHARSQAGRGDIVDVPGIEHRKRADAVDPGDGVMEVEVPPFRVPERARGAGVVPIVERIVLERDRAGRPWRRIEARGRLLRARVKHAAYEQRIHQDVPLAVSETEDSI
jgi:hypothetical protein